MESEPYTLQVDAPSGAPSVTLEVAPGVSVLVYSDVVVVYSDRVVEVRCQPKATPTA